MEAKVEVDIYLELGTQLVPLYTDQYNDIAKEVIL